MPSDEIENLLRNDFDALADRLEHDRFSARLLFRLKTKERARLGVIAFAGGLGAAFAAAQFTGVAELIAPYFNQLPTTASGDDGIAQLASLMILAAAVATTTLILRRDA